MCVNFETMLAKHNYNDLKIITLSQAILNKSKRVVIPSFRTTFVKCICISIACFTDLGKLNLAMVVQF